MTTAQDLPASPIADLAAAAPPLRLVEPPAPTDLDFEAFVRRYETRLRRLVLRRLGDLGEAEEITQETLLRAYQHRASFAAEDELIAWSTVVAQRLVIDRVRVRGRAVAVAEVPEGARVGRDTADIVVARSEARTALEALEAIPERQAAILWAREVEGLHYDDIAERFGITEPAVRSLLHRGRRALRKEYARRGGSLPLAGLIPFAPWLIALKKLAKVRTAAKATVPTGLSALAIAGMTALTIGGGFGAGTPGTGRPIALAPGSAHRSAYAQIALPRDPEVRVLGGSSRAAVAPPGTGRRILPIAPGRNCYGNGTRACLTIDEVDHPGDVVRIGPELPENPTGLRQVGYGSEYVPLCFVVKYVPATECTSGTRRRVLAVSAQPEAHVDPEYYADPTPVDGEAR